MSVVRVLFTRRHHPGSVAIRLATWSLWSHVDLLLDEPGPAARLVGAVAPAGVKEALLATRLAHASRAAIVEFPVQNPQAVLDVATSQIGRPYDWLGCAGIALRNRDWQEPDSWFCSELVAYAFGQAGEPLFRDDMVSRITPQHLWMLAKPSRRPSEPMDLIYTQLP